MGLKCSFLGHQFEEPRLVNEREERGDDVIDVKRRVMVCSICGERRVLAERKEITKQTIDEREHENTETLDDASETIDDSDLEATESDQEQTDDPAGIDDTDAESSGFAGVDIVDSDSTEPTEAPTEEHRDDGVILSEDDTISRSPSNWSTESDDHLGESWHPATKTHPHQREERELPDVITAAADDGEILASASTGATERDTASRMSTEATTDESTTDTEQNSSEFNEEVIFCSTCEFSVLAANSPFRSGDICPQCHDAYLTDRASSCHRSRE
ncbi:DUF7093 family protein [Halocatena pleomorpha]|uniref:Uncharacterized protein n=1 Tax=Halocatena pleomorpha TaxID=1785090 RepID=A0A3P3R8R9_9EURY|nr:hypothetical protein [Halocatena pleomorpha]RRJ28933.1 hypothetical protein EIK79_14560 [Halocatena pleomorpha]